ncbi:TPA: hypothetical protein ACLT9D_002252 [Neisseria gonorrhoeae]
MDEKVKAILATIVEKNGIALSPKDPIMVVFTALEYMLSEQHAEQKALTVLFKAQVEEATGNWIQSVHQQTEELVSQQLNTTKEQAKEMSKLLLHETDRLLEQRITDAVKDFEGKLYRINDNAMNAVELRIKETRNTAILNLTAALIVLLAVIILAFKFTF